MGKSSKFSLPFPRRRRQEKTKCVVESPSAPSITISKAQRILGAEGDLNIDSPVRSNRGWRRSHRPSLSVVSLTGYESTEADESVCTSDDNISWSEEAGVFPYRGLCGISSSPMFAGHNHEKPAMDTLSLEERVLAKNPSPTLTSYYDRQKAPLSVSQQTSASSIRDLALRKGFPQITTFHRSPVIEVESPNEERDATHSAPLSAFKMPSRMDISRLFPKQRKDKTTSPDSDTKYSSSTISVSSGALDSGCDMRRKLDATGEPRPGKTIQREDEAKFLRWNVKGSAEMSNTGRRKNSRYQKAANSVARYDSERHKSRNSTCEAYPLDGQCVKHPKPQESYTHRLKNALCETKQRHPEFLHDRSCDQHVSREDPNGNVGFLSPHWEARSFTSLSSHNTKGSRRTNGSVFSNSDLKNNSVLSISSDEDTDEETSRKISRFAGQQTPITFDQANDQENALPRGPDKSLDRALKGSIPDVNASARISRVQEANFLIIPPPSPAGSRISGPWNATNPSEERQSIVPNLRGSKLNVESRRPSPPLSTPSSSQSRIMAVTRQEEALIEALRQKRARMKATVAKHSKCESRPPIPLHHKVRDSESSILTVKPEKPNGKQRILLFLDQPIPDGRQIETAEPSPDLSDFLSFGSDEDAGSTPRTSWLVSREHGRPDSITHLEERSCPIEPKIAARLSAVGALRGVAKGGQGNGPKQRHNVNHGVTFLDSTKSNTENLLDGDNSIWGL